MPKVELHAHLLGTVCRETFTDLSRRAGWPVTLIQRSGSAANLNIHLHCLVQGGVYRCSSRRLDTQGETGSAMAPMIPRGLRSRMVVRARRNRPPWGNAETDKPA